MISENAGGHWHGTRREHHISGISHSFQYRRCLPGGIIPASVSKRLRLPEMWVYGILPSSRTEHVPVPRLSASNVRHGRDGHAPHAPAADGLVLDDLSLCHGQTRHFCRSAEPHAEHLLWVGAVSFARKMARLCSRGCRLLKMSPVARSSRSLTKLLCRAQKSNATATDSIAEKPAIRSSCAWQEPSLHLALCCVKPIST